VTDVVVDDDNQYWSPRLSVEVTKMTPYILCDVGSKQPGNEA